MKATTQERTTETQRPQRKANRISVHSVSLWLTCLLAALVVLALAVGAGIVYAQAGGGHDLTWNTVDGGGVTRSTASGGGYTLGGTAGQPDAARWSGGGYTLNGGFWHAGEVTGWTPPGEGPVYLPLIIKR